MDKAAGLVNSVIKGEKISKLSNLSAQNLYGIIHMSTAGLTVKLETDFDKAIRILQDCLTLLHSDDIVVRPLIYDLISEIQHERLLKTEIRLKSPKD